MSVQLSSNATNVLANAFGSSSSTYSGLVSAAQTSPYLAGLLNAFGANGGTMTVRTGTGTSTLGNDITIDSGMMPSAVIDPLKDYGDSALNHSIPTRLVVWELSHSGELSALSP